MVSTQKPNNVDVVVSSVGGGVVVVWSFMGMERDVFWGFLMAFLHQMGFSNPRLVQFARDARGQLDWNRLRVGSEEFEIHRVDQEEAVARAVVWLRSPDTARRYGRCFTVEGHI